MPPNTIPLGHDINILQLHQSFHSINDHHVDTFGQPIPTEQTNYKEDHSIMHQSIHGEKEDIPNVVVENQGKIFLSDSETLKNLLLVLPYYYMYLSIGLTTGSLGVSLPSISTSSKTPIEQMGWVYTLKALGAIVAYVFTGKIYDKFSKKSSIAVNGVLGLALFFCGLNFSLIPLVPNFPLLLVCFFVHGMTVGTLGLGCNIAMFWLLKEKGFGAFTSPLVLALFELSTLGGFALFSLFLWSSLVPLVFIHMLFPMISHSPRMITTFPWLHIFKPNHTHSAFDSAKAEQNENEQTSPQEVYEQEMYMELEENLESSIQSIQSNIQEESPTECMNSSPVPSSTTISDVSVSFGSYDNLAELERSEMQYKLANSDIEQLVKTTDTCQDIISKQTIHFDKPSKSIYMYISSTVNSTWEKSQTIRIGFTVGMSLFGIIALEATIGALFFTFVESKGVVSNQTNGMMTSAFWFCLTLLRVLSIPISKILKPWMMLLLDLCGVSIATMIFLFVPCSSVSLWVGIVLMGTSTSSQYPVVSSYPSTAFKGLNVTAQMTSVMMMMATSAEMTIPLLTTTLFKVFGKNVMFYVIGCVCAYLSVSYTILFLCTYMFNRKNIVPKKDVLTSC